MEASGRSSTLLGEAAHQPQASLQWACCSILRILHVRYFLLLCLQGGRWLCLYNPVPTMKPIHCGGVVQSFLHCTGHRPSRPGRLGCSNVCEPRRQVQDLHPSLKENQTLPQQCLLPLSDSDIVNCPDLIPLALFWSSCLWFSWP